jgi:MarR family transcriptional repressor of emrRAB
MIDKSANLLGAVGLAVADRIEAAALAVLNHAGETPAALVVIGYGLGPSNEQLRRVLRLSHPGCVRLVDRLAADGLLERRPGQDKRAVALHLTERGMELREEVLRGRLAALRILLLPLTGPEQIVLAELLEKILSAIGISDGDRCTICRMCNDTVCIDCPIPAEFRRNRAVN